MKDVRKPPGGYDFDRKSAAEYLSSKPATLTWWAACGTGPAYAVVGGKAWYKQADLDAYIARRVRLPVTDRDAQDKRVVARAK